MTEANTVLAQYRSFTESLVEEHKTQLAEAHHILQGKVAALEEAHAEQDTTIRLQELVNRATSTRELMHLVTDYFRNWLKCDAVGIRLRVGEDFPYYETTGFSESFVLAENSLCASDSKGELVRDSAGNAVLACMCGTVISGCSDPSKPFFTERGSFWTNCTTEADRQACTRNRCNGEYESVGLFPLRVGTETYGLLQITAKRKGLFSTARVACLERLGGFLAVALSQRRTEEALREGEKALRVSNRAYSVLGQGNEALVHARSESGLLHDICRILVEKGGYRLAWVGFAEQETAKSVRPVAHAGYEKEYLDELNIAWADTEVGRGPTGSAIRTGRPAVARHILTDPQFAPWREAALERGYASSISLPLMADERAFGALNIYSSEPDAFSDPEAELLARLADDLTYGIKALRTQEKHKRAEAELANHSDHLEELVEERSRELEASRMQLHRTERLASVGTLAAGIAHEINNPLGLILMSAQRALEKGGDPKAVETSLHRIKDDVKRCARIVKSVLQFSRDQSSDKWPVDVNECFRRSEEFTREYASRQGVRVQFESASDLPTVLANPTELEQAFVNLIHNAVEACSDGQTVTLRTERSPSGVRFTIADQGRGMTVEEREHAFDPFYTTRQQKGGTGLGLSIVHGIITEQGGTIDIDSQPGKGTRVIIELPVEVRENSKE